jgi:hypothetical protein
MFGILAVEKRYAGLLTSTRSRLLRSSDPPRARRQRNTFLGSPRILPRSRLCGFYRDRTRGFRKVRGGRPSEKVRGGRPSDEYVRLHGHTMRPDRLLVTSYCRSNTWGPNLLQQVELQIQLETRHTTACSAASAPLNS